MNTALRKGIDIRFQTTVLALNLVLSIPIFLVSVMILTVGNLQDYFEGGNANFSAGLPELYFWSIGLLLVCSTLIILESLMLAMRRWTYSVGLAAIGFFLVALSCAVEGAVSFATGVSGNDFMYSLVYACVSVEMGFANVIVFGKTRFWS